MRVVELNESNSVTTAPSRRRNSASRALFGDVMQFIEFTSVVFASVLVAFIYHRYQLRTDFDFQNYAAAGIIGATGLTALLRRDGYYEFDQFLRATGVIRAIVGRWLLVVLGLIAFGFALKVSDSFSRAWLFVWAISVIVVILAIRWVGFRIAQSMIRDGGIFARRIAVIGASKVAEDFSKAVSADKFGVSVFGVFKAPAESGSLMEEIPALESAARAGEIDDIVIAAPELDKMDMERLVRRLSILPVSISICPSAHWLYHRGGGVSQLAGVSVLSLYRRPLEGWGSVFKVVEDYVLGTLSILLASPVMLVIALAIKIQDGGPILFSQQRHGFNNSVFRIYKFRTMSVMEDGDEIKQAQRGDARITPLGRFLRRYSLDELPQLFNVIGGHMSLIGPRPHALAHNHQYAQLIENYSGRHKVKPGITGWAQVNGYRGETSENELMEERVRYDLTYIDNWSLWFDLKILAMTGLAVVFPKNAV